MMVRMRAFGSILIVVALSHWVRAQPAPPSPAEALFAEGRALLDAGQAAEACAKFEQALKLDPEGLGVILNLGLCNEQRDRLATALTWFRRVQARASELGKPDTEAAAKDKTTALAQKVPTIKIAFAVQPPAGTVVTLDGATVAEIDYGRIEVDAGHHAVDVAAPKLPPVHVELELADGKAETVPVDLAPKPVPPPKRFVVVDHGRSERHRAYILGGVGGVLTIGGVALGLVAYSHYNATDMLDSRDSWRSLMRYGGSALFLVGGAAIAAGVVVYRRAPKPEQIEVTPSITRDTVGVAVGRAF
jgi:tetratricopeptide (TPR) repeat protein